MTLDADFEEFTGLTALIDNKLASGREQDLVDVKVLKNAKSN